MRTLALLPLLSMMSGCAPTHDVNLGFTDTEVALDGGSSPIAFDPCGNGADDDQDGRIDEGCPCGPREAQSCFPGRHMNRRVGTCTDGIQVCRTEGSEWGDWGNSPCEGATLPDVEQCDQMDHDCDGARDEDCACSPGETRECGTRFALSPCMSGTQTCGSSGMWGGCEGAIGPTSDVCDGIDNDCDGVIDQGCGCVPTPELCGDDIDSDCDGRIHEPACMPNWPTEERPCDPELASPRLVSPLSTSRATSTRPMLTWELPEGISAAAIDLCATPDCSIVRESFIATRTARPQEPLPYGPSFWRARSVGTDGHSCASTPIWEIVVGHGDAPINTTQGFMMDLNRDGHPDFSLGLQVPPALHVVYGSESGTSLGAGTTLLVSPEGDGPLFPHVGGDLDGDGFGDLLTLDGAQEGPCRVFRGSASGLAPSPAATYDHCIGISGLGDFDGDGYGDFIWRHADNRVFAVFGQPELSSSSIALVIVPSGRDEYRFHQAGDINGDRLADIVMVRTHDFTIGQNRSIMTVHYGNPARTFAGVTVATDLGFPLPHAAGDINGDGYGDIATVQAGSAIWALGGATGLSAWIAGPTLPNPELRRSATRLGDINGDGFEDFEFGLLIFLGSSRGPVQTSAPALISGSGGVYYEYRDGLRSTAGVGDLDGDGREDIVTPDASIRFGMPHGLGSPHRLLVDGSIATAAGISDD